MHQHQSDDLIRLFNQTFAEKFNTRLLNAADEPLYLPADQHCHYHRILFAHGFFASALHEIAHWCIAGEQRRLLTDYGYWYEADGRSAAQQAEFERVEVKPQALELLFAEAAGFAFRVSVDNLNGEFTDPAPFRHAVEQQAQRYRIAGLPVRAQMFVDALNRFYAKP